MKKNRRPSLGGSFVVWAICFLVTGVILGILQSSLKISLGAIPVVLIFLAAGGISTLISRALGFEQRIPWVKGKGSQKDKDPTADQTKTSASDTGAVQKKTEDIKPVKKQRPPSKPIPANGFFRGLLNRPNYNPPTLRKESFIEKYAYILYVLLAFLIPFLLMFFAFKVMGVSPYGNKQILVTDLWHQYYPFIVDYQSKLKAGESLLWSWTSGGGTNYVALIAYYLASPLNFISVLVPADQLREFLFYILCVKIGLAGMFYSLFIRIAFKRKDLSITAFGIMYALCAFMMGYYWNIIWLDSVALLPLVIAGTICLLRDGKFRLYIVSLALSILANYYIGLFVCVFVLLVSVGYSIVELKSVKKIVKDFFKMAGCSIVAIMMTAILTLPAYFALGHAYSSSNSFPEKFAVNIGSTPDFAGVLEGICKTISNSVAFVQPTAKEGLPNVYTGVITVFLAILFLFCSKIKRRERIFCGLLLLFFLTSFVIRQLDYIWHGFHFPNMLPYRFSFLWSFTLIYMAFRVFMYIDYVKPASVLAAIGGFFVYLYIAGIYIKEANVNISTLFAEVKDGQPDVDPVLLSGWIGMILAAFIMLYVLREQLPRLVITLGMAAVSLTAMFFVLDIYKKLNKELLKAPENPEAVDSTAAQAAADKAEAFPTVFTWIFVIVMIAVTILLLSRLNENHVILKTVLSCILVIMALFEGVFSAVTGVRTVSVTDSTTYPLGTTSTAECVKYINEQEKDIVDIPRTEFTRYHTLNDNAVNSFYDDEDKTLNSVNGISMFNSMVNMPITNYMEKFGICGWIASNRYTYMETSPFTNLMLNLKYLIDPYYGNYVDKRHFDKVYTATAPKSNEYSSTPAFVMKNRYYLPMGFMVKESLLRYKASDPTAFVNAVARTKLKKDPVAVSNNPVENQNTFFRLATGMDQDIYTLLPIESSNTDTGKLSETVDNQFSYSSDSKSGAYSFETTVPEDGTALAYVEGYGVEDANLYINGSYIGHYGTKRPLIMTFGDVKKGDKIKAEAKVPDNASGTITCNLIMFNEQAFQAAYKQFGQSVLEADTVSGTELSGTIDVKENGLFYTSIPYVTGWKAYVDDEEVEITPVGDAMLAFKLSAGKHTIRLKYSPEGFTAGVVISLLGLFIFILMILAYWQRKRLQPVWERVTGKAKGLLKIKKSAGSTDAESADDASAEIDDEPTAELVEEPVTELADEPVTELADDNESES